MLHYYLMTGGIVVAKGPSLVTTVLGSCVSATFYDRERRRGAIMHALLPRMADYCDEPGTDNRQPWRYVDSAISAVTEKFVRAGVGLNKLQIKVFGGAEVLMPQEKTLGDKSVGRQNVKVAFETIQRLGLKVVNADVGGSRGRKIIFNTQNGEVYLKRLHAPEERIACGLGLVGG